MIINLHNMPIIKGYIYSYVPTVVKNYKNYQEALNEFTLAPKEDD